MTGRFRSMSRPFKLVMPWGLVFENLLEPDVRALFKQTGWLLATL